MGRRRLPEEERRRRRNAQWRKQNRKAYRRRKLEKAKAEGATDPTPDDCTSYAIEAKLAGHSFVSRHTLRKPTFVVITPNGTRIETLEPDLA